VDLPVAMEPVRPRRSMVAVGVSCGRWRWVGRRIGWQVWVVDPVVGGVFTSWSMEAVGRALERRGTSERVMAALHRAEGKSF
jgi:hypothetical protein